MAPWPLSPLSGFVHSQYTSDFKRGTWKMRIVKLVSTFANYSLHCKSATVTLRMELAIQSASTGSLMRAFARGPP